MADFTTTKRARLGPARGSEFEVLGANDCENLLQPLWPTRGMLWPYTPSVTAGASAAYGSFHFTHSNYQFWNYQNSSPMAIQVAGTFTAQTNEEGRYMVAMLRFLRSVTMMEFGIPAAQLGRAGTPPPVLRFNYLGAHMFNNIPVIVTDFSFTLERDIDYVEVQMPFNGNRGLAGFFNDSLFGDTVRTDGDRTYVPTRLELITSLQIQQNPRNVRENFDLNAFKRGDLINKGFT